jgi:hypothetical protein
MATIIYGKIIKTCKYLNILQDDNALSPLHSVMRVSALFLASVKVQVIGRGSSFWDWLPVLLPICFWRVTQRLSSVIPTTPVVDNLARCVTLTRHLWSTTWIRCNLSATKSLMVTCLPCWSKPYSEKMYLWKSLYQLSLATFGETSNDTTKRSVGNDLFRPLRTRNSISIKHWTTWHLS